MAHESFGETYTARRPAQELQACEAPQPEPEPTQPAKKKKKKKRSKPRRRDVWGE